MNIMLPILCLHCTEWSGIPQPCCPHILPGELHLWQMFECCDDFSTANEEAYFRMARTTCPSQEIITRKHSQCKFAQEVSTWQLGFQVKRWGKQVQAPVSTWQVTTGWEGIPGRLSDQWLLSDTHSQCEPGEHHWILTAPLQWEEERKEGTQEEEEVWQVISHPST